jgi:hypothetical protein
MSSNLEVAASSLLRIAVRSILCIVGRDRVVGHEHGGMWQRVLLTKNRGITIPFDEGSQIMHVVGCHGGCRDQRC